jgi:hypothetical protein
MTSQKRKIGPVARVVLLGGALALILGYRFVTDQLGRRLPASPPKTTLAAAPIKVVDPVQQAKRKKAMSVFISAEMVLKVDAPGTPFHGFYTGALWEALNIDQKGNVAKTVWLYQNGNDTSGRTRVYSGSTGKEIGSVSLYEGFKLH